MKRKEGRPNKPKSSGPKAEEPPSEGVPDNTGSIALDRDDDRQAPVRRRRRHHEPESVEGQLHTVHEPEIEEEEVEEREGRGNKEGHGDDRKQHGHDDEDRLDDHVFEAGIDPAWTGRARRRLKPEAAAFEVGDTRLTDPDEIQRALGAPIAFAKHAMILSEAFRYTTGATRAEALEYLASLFSSSADRSFARAALREFGPGTGIVDIYPLEVVELLLETHPGFLPKIGFGKVFPQAGQRERPLVTDTATPVELEHPPGLRIRRFALKGGGCPGYVFEPSPTENRYRLTIQSAGSFDLLVSGVVRSGHTIVQRVYLRVLPSRGDAAAPPSMFKNTYPPRDADKVAEWPKPTPRKVSLAEVFEVMRDDSDEDRARQEEIRAELASRRARGFGADELPRIGEDAFAGDFSSWGFDPLMLDASKAPVLDASKAPVLDASKAPVLDASKAPVLDASKAPVLDASKAPGLDASKAPALNAPKRVSRSVEATRPPHSKANAPERRRHERKDAERPRVRFGGSVDVGAQTKADDESQLPRDASEKRSTRPAREADGLRPQSRRPEPRAPLERADTIGAQIDLPDEESRREAIGRGVATQAPERGRFDPQDDEDEEALHRPAPSGPRESGAPRKEVISETEPSDPDALELLAPLTASPIVRPRPATAAGPPWMKVRAFADAETKEIDHPDASVKQDAAVVIDFGERPTSEHRMDEVAPLLGAVATPDPAPIPDVGRPMRAHDPATADPPTAEIDVSRFAVRPKPVLASAIVETAEHELPLGGHRLPSPPRRSSFDPNTLDGPTESISVEVAMSAIGFGSSPPVDPAFQEEVPTEASLVDVPVLRAARPGFLSVSRDDPTRRLPTLDAERKKR
ncbi:MAG: hypothetical protein HYV07_15810 [Deltaproteobacteria bacterium]|nr:hypothetical protein [Deltaproteobacteria bacterium]